LLKHGCDPTERDGVPGTREWKGDVQPGRLTESFRNVYPLPASEVIANPNLKQNTGY